MDKPPPLYSPPKAPTPSEVLRDRLAGRRTVMAGERTLLSYIRTALTFFIAGVTFIKFFDHTAIEVVGWVFIPASGLTAIMGVWSYRRTRKAINDSVCEEEAAGE